MPDTMPDAPPNPDSHIKSTQVFTHLPSEIQELEHAQIHAQIQALAQQTTHNGALEILESRLQAARDSHHYRELRYPRGLDFSSNDYLNFSQDEELQENIQLALKHCPAGASASRLIRGNLELFTSIEAQLAEFCGQERALLFCSGYQANIALFSSLARDQDVYFSDQNNHASIIDGMRLSRAEKIIYPHCDVASLRRGLEEKHLSRLKIIVTESVFSMDGTVAPLKQILELAEEHQALVVVDEAHATGLWGDFSRLRGGGIAQELNLSHKVFATIHTGGKALGTSGAWIAGSSKLIEYLINFSRPFIYTTAPFPFLAATLDASIEHWKKIGRVRAQAVFLNALILREGIRNLRNFQKNSEKNPEKNSMLHPMLETPRHEKFPTPIPKTPPIIPMILGDNLVALQISQHLQDSGFDVMAIRPPTVPVGSSRIRFTVNAGHQQEEILNLLSLLDHFPCSIH